MTYEIMKDTATDSKERQKSEKKWKTILNEEITGI